MPTDNGNLVKISLQGFSVLGKRAQPFSDGVTYPDIFFSSIGLCRKSRFEFHEPFLIIKWLLFKIESIDIRQTLRQKNTELML